MRGLDWSSTQNMGTESVSIMLTVSYAHSSVSCIGAALNASTLAANRFSEANKSEVGYPLIQKGHRTILL